jgi:hypothetical protein
MRFESANPSVVRSVRQRGLLNAVIGLDFITGAAGQRASEDVIELS